MEDMKFWRRNHLDNGMMKDQERAERKMTKWFLGK
jgi:hypothetical protein